MLSTLAVLVSLTGVMAQQSGFYGTLGGLQTLNATGSSTFNLLADSKNSSNSLKWSINVGVGFRTVDGNFSAIETLWLSPQTDKIAKPDRNICANIFDKVKITPQSASSTSDDACEQILGSTCASAIRTALQGNIQDPCKIDSSSFGNALEQSCQGIAEYSGSSATIGMPMKTSQPFALSSPDETHAYKVIVLYDGNANEELF